MFMFVHVQECLYFGAVIKLYQLEQVQYNRTRSRGNSVASNITVCLRRNLSHTTYLSLSCCLAKYDLFRLGCFHFFYLSLPCCYLSRGVLLLTGTGVKWPGCRCGIQHHSKTKMFLHWTLHFVKKLYFSKISLTTRDFFIWNKIRKPVTELTYVYSSANKNIVICTESTLNITLLIK